MIQMHDCLGKINDDFSCELPMVIAKIGMISSGLIDGYFDEIDESNGRYKICLMMSLMI